MRTVFYAGQLVVTLLVVTPVARYVPFPWSPVLSLAVIWLVVLATLVVQVRCRVAPTPAFTRLPAQAVDPRLRALAETVLLAHLAGRPDWALTGWVAGAEGDQRLLAGNGRAFAMVGLGPAGLTPVSVCASSGARRFEGWQATVKQYLWLSPCDPWEFALVDRPEGDLLRVFDVMTSGADLDPVPDPAAALQALARLDHGYQNTKWGRYLDVQGRGRVSWAAACATVWRWLPGVRHTLARRENARTDAMVYTAVRAAASRLPLQRAVSC